MVRANEEERSGSIKPLVNQELYFGQHASLKH